MGHYGTVPGIPAVQAIHRADGQQSPHLYSYDTKSRCPGPPLGCRPVRLQHDHKYLKGSDNKVADTLGRIEARLDPDTVTELLNHAKVGAPAQAETDDIRIIEEEEGLTRRSSSGPSNWLARTRNSVISVLRTGTKLN